MKVADFVATSLHNCTLLYFLHTIASLTTQSIRPWPLQLQHTYSTSSLKRQSSAFLSVSGIKLNSCKTLPHTKTVLLNTIHASVLPDTHISFLLLMPLSGSCQLFSTVISLLCLPLPPPSGSFTVQEVVNHLKSKIDATPNSNEQLYNLRSGYGIVQSSLQNMLIQDKH